MINFFKRLFGLNTTPAVTKASTAPYKIEPPKEWTSVDINLSKSNVTKVRAITETGSDAVKAAHAPKPANKKRRPYRGNKLKAGSTKATVTPITEGKTKGGNGQIKPAQVARVKPQAPKAPIAGKK